MIYGVPLGELLRLMQAHLLLSGCAVLAAIVVGLPIAIWSAHNRRASAPLLGAISLAQTIPGLALLALFYPLLLLLARATGLADPGAGLPPGAARADDLCAAADRPQRRRGDPRDRSRPCARRRTGWA